MMFIYMTHCNSFDGGFKIEIVQQFYPKLALRRDKHYI